MDFLYHQLERPEWSRKLQFISRKSFVIMNCLQSTLNISFCSSEERNFGQISLKSEIKYMVINSLDYNNISIFVFIINNIVSVVLSKLSIFHIEYKITHYSTNHLPHLQKSRIRNNLIVRIAVIWKLSKKHLRVLDSKTGRHFELHRLKWKEGSLL